MNNIKKHINAVTTVRIFSSKTITAMEMLFVDKNLKRLKAKFPESNDFKEYEKIDDFTYNPIDPEMNSASDSKYFGVTIGYKAFLSTKKDFIIWIPEKGGFLATTVHIVKCLNAMKEEIYDENTNEKGTLTEQSDVRSKTTNSLSTFRLTAPGCDISGSQFSLIATFREFQALSWGLQKYKRHAFAPLICVVYSARLDEIDDIAHRIVVEPKLESVGESVDRLLLNSCYYRIVFENNPNFNSAYKKLVSKPDLEKLTFKEFGINGKGKKCFLSQELQVKEVLELLNYHPCAMLYEICLLKVKIVNKRDLDKFSKAMVSPYCHSDRIYDPFVEFVEFVAHVERDQVFARLFHIAQSSGTGKTMLCLHLIHKLGKGIYCVFRPDGSTGFPPTTAWLRRLIDLFKGMTSDEEAVNLCLAFIVASLTTFHSYTPRTKIVEFYTSSTEITSPKFFEEFNRLISLSEADLLSELTSLETLIGDFFPIVLDERHELLCIPKNSSSSAGSITLYRAFRRAMAKIKDRRIVVICLGTKSPLNDFVLNYRMDSSARPVGVIKPIKPYIFVQSFDVFALDSSGLVPYQKLVVNGKLKTDCLKAFSLNYGRPLWHAYETYSAGMYAAALKLSTDDTIARLSAFVMRTGAPVVPSCQLAHRLVHSGMAALEYVDVLGESCYVTYCAEPVLASAARLYCGSLDNLKTVLTEFTEYVDRRYVLDSGSSGEFIARVILLRAMDSLAENCCSSVDTSMFNSVNQDWINSVAMGRLNVSLPNNTPSFPDYFAVKLRDFLTKLAGLTEAEITALGLSEAMLDGLVNVNQFIACKRPYAFSQAVLKEAFLRGIGLSLPVNWPGADLLIPVLRSDNLFSAVMVQVKNLDQMSIPGSTSALSKEIISKLTAKYTLLEDALKDIVPDQEFVKIVIQFALPREGNQTTFGDLVQIRPCKPDAGRGEVLWILGLAGFKHLFTHPHRGSAKFNAEILAGLNSILNNARDFVDSINEDVSLKTTHSQTKKEGIRTLLNTYIPLKTSQHISLLQSSPTKAGLKRTVTSGRKGNAKKKQKPGKIIARGKGSAQKKQNKPSAPAKAPTTK